MLPGTSHLLFTLEATGSQGSAQAALWGHPSPLLPNRHVGHECPQDSWSLEASAQCQSSWDQVLGLPHTYLPVSTGAFLECALRLTALPHCRGPERPCSRGRDMARLLL